MVIPRMPHVLASSEGYLTSDLTSRSQRVGCLETLAAKLGASVATTAPGAMPTRAATTNSGVYGYEYTP
jgi:hypothetical protein